MRNYENVRLEQYAIVQKLNLRSFIKICFMPCNTVPLSQGFIQNFWCFLHKWNFYSLFNCSQRALPRKFSSNLKWASAERALRPKLVFNTASSVFLVIRAWRTILHGEKCSQELFIHFHKTSLASVERVIPENEIPSFSWLKLQCDNIATRRFCNPLGNVPLFCLSLFQSLHHCQNVSS